MVIGHQDAATGSARDISMPEASAGPQGKVNTLNAESEDQVPERKLLSD